MTSTVPTYDNLRSAMATSQPNSGNNTTPVICGLCPYLTATYQTQATTAAATLHIQGSLCFSMAYCPPSSHNVPVTPFILLSIDCRYELQT